MTNGFDLDKFKKKASLNGRYEKQLQRLRRRGFDTSCIEDAVRETSDNLAEGSSSLVIYGEPQSGKTEMMICLTARLLDQGRPIIVHLLNDSLDLLTQNLKRFTKSGLAPAARNSTEVVESNADEAPKELVIFCKKNAKDLDNLNGWLRDKPKARITVIDDEADYATPNSKVNKGLRTTINRLIGDLLGSDGTYIGVTATPARLDLNKTFQNDPSSWVYFRSHANYTGQDTFFPLNKRVEYRLTLLDAPISQQAAKIAFARFLVSVAFLNSRDNESEQNYTLLVHTSGKKEDHKRDHQMFDGFVKDLLNPDGSGFAELAEMVFEQSSKLYPDADPESLTEYVIRNASRATLIVLNSERDRRAAGESPSEPSSPFTIIIGGNIVSRGVTFPNLLSMFFTRTVQQRLQQDTYIQRARMFGDRGSYLPHFELTIPSQLYADWHKCFVFHKLALQTIRSKIGLPVWVGDNSVSVAASSSINKATVMFDKGEMSFAILDYSSKLDTVISAAPTDINTLRALNSEVGNEALPIFLIDYIQSSLDASPDPDGLLAIHTSSSIAGSVDADQAKIYRKRGFIGQSQLEVRRFPNAVHHVKIFHNGKGKAKIFYKFKGSITFMQNLANSK